ncbi:hypothetical protein TGAM01_v210756 [Trichoderma gamsii]|uniref:Uncharacterized protein n=1 Tax=Trichoderma gamsii TaxID=398673 RepID=A0A2P4Z7V6_9HYPO|nr:hypothetical protein TGAM01_v210756 [Trichoderma gamsii]PON20377.1 hypothetical protein TGAM01_v210756 [Trichoderma gamsii]
MLQDLSLTLDCSDTRVLAEQEGDDDSNAELESPNDPSFDEFDQKMLKVPLDYNRYPRKGHVRDAFINCAVDENLARSIFVVILSGKNKSIRPLLLCRLKIDVIGGCSFGTSVSVSILSDVIDELSRSWTVERSLVQADDILQKLEVHEGTNQIQQRHFGCSDSLHPEVEQIFRRIWPTKGKKVLNWRKEWHSLPLASNMELKCLFQAFIVENKAAATITTIQFDH